jgi:hypothetical protein
VGVGCCFPKLTRGKSRLPQGDKDSWRSISESCRESQFAGTATLHGEERNGGCWVKLDGNDQDHISSHAAANFKAHTNGFEKHTALGID